ncbi:hypothetical protein [Novosphingobium terrae]|uniref:hypothetical protein n=1 Tax=Novosphingobium terrae TaxID=2726189 RepID=UPI001981B617|nr:hypothetical protein [Novosphingobium terrae]
MSRAAASHVARRARQSAPRAFPARPTLPAQTPCRALAFVVRAGGGLPALHSLRDRVSEMRRGSIGSGARARTVLILLFHGPPAPHGADHPTALPLVGTEHGGLTSHLHETGADGAGDHLGRRVDLWWSGAVHHLVLDVLEPVSLGTLWSLPEVTIHPADAPQPRMAGSDAGPSGMVPRDPEPGEHLSPLHRRTPPLPRVEDNPFRELHEAIARRPSLRSLWRRRVQGGLSPQEKRWLFGGLTLLAGLCALPLVVLAVGGSFWSLLPFFVGAAGAAGARRGGSSSPAGSHARGVPSAPRQGLFDHLTNWLRWHMPASTLRSQLDARVKRIESLAGQGAIDEALRLALRLNTKGDKQPQSKRYPKQLPAARARLDFDMTPLSSVAPILGPQHGGALLACYHQLAQKLEREGDHRRAAFIHSQLLGQHAQAALLLEKGGLSEEAAQLAYAAQLAPSLTVRLLYAAGQADRALALARRTGCFDELARDSRGKDPAYHAYVVGAWSDLLVESGQPLRALQVTDEVAGRQDADPALLRARRRWLEQVGEADARSGFQAEAVVRVLLSGALAQADALAAFPAVSPLPQDRLDALALAALQQAARSEDAGEGMLAALDVWNRLAARASPEQTRFWDGGGPALIEAFARAVLQGASARLAPGDLAGLQRLLRLAGLTVLAADIGKLGKLHRAAQKPARQWQVRPAATLRPQVLAGCLLGNGLVLAWRANETLEVFDRHGAPVWRHHLPEVTALVPLGSGGEALIVQRAPECKSRVSRYTAHDGRFHAIGLVDLVAHHAITSDTAWLVQIGGEFGALGLAALCAREPRFEFLWSCALTERVRAVAFLHGPQAASWITIDMTGDRHGVVEMWSMQSNGQLTTSLCLALSSQGDDAPLPPVSWGWGHRAGTSMVQPIDGSAARMVVVPWAEDQEGRARQIAARRQPFEADDSFAPCDFGRQLVHYSRATEAAGAQDETAILRFGDRASAFVLRHAGDCMLTCLARSAGTVQTPDAKAAQTDTGARVMLADPFGQIFLVDPERARVTVV